MFGKEIRTTRLIGGFLISEQGTVVDAFNKEQFEVTVIDGIPYVGLPAGTLNFKNNIGRFCRVMDLIGFAFMKPKVRIDELEQLACLPIDGDHSNVKLDNLTWKYPVGGMMSWDFPGFYYIPDYSGYVVRKSGADWEVVNTETCYKKQWYVGDTGYLQVSLRNDSRGRSEGVTLHRILALTFTDYPLDYRDLAVDHVDHDRTNNAVENFQWITIGENIRKGVYHNLELANGTKEPAAPANSQNRIKRLVGKFKYLDVRSGNHFVIERLEDTLKELKLGDWQIRQSVIAGEEGKIGLVMGRYVFRRIDEDFPQVTEEALKDHLSYGGQPRATECKDSGTGEIKQFRSAAEMVRSLGLSKKVVTTRLRRGEQKIPGTTFLAKYKDDPTPWTE